MFAQVEPLTQQSLGMFFVAFMVALVVLAAIVTIAGGIKLLFLKPTPAAIQILPADAPLTQRDLDAAVSQINTKIDGLASRETVTAIGGRLLNVESEQKRMETYTHQSMHVVRNELHYLSVTLAVIAAKLNVHIPDRPHTKPDDVTTPHVPTT